MSIHTLRQQQWIPRPLDEVFAFFSDARNLEAITPSWLGFKILWMSSDSIAQGTQIRYRLKLHGLPIYWRTEIRLWQPPHRFVDVELAGPYQLWHHTHTFEAHGDRTLMKDVARYKLPFGPLGEVVHALKVRSDVRQIFAFRREQIDAYFAPGGQGESIQ